MPASTSSEGESASPRAGASVHGALRAVLATALLLLSGSIFPSRAETGLNAWLRYQRIDEKSAKEQYAQLPAIVVTLGKSEVVAAARDELIRGVRGMLEHTMRAQTDLPKERAILLGTFEEVKAALSILDKFPQLADDGFWFKSVEVDGQSYLLVTAPNERGVLYGTFALLRKIALAQPLSSLNESQQPAAPLRMLSHWDRLDGSVALHGAERSIFWSAGAATKNLDRVRDYGRLLASVGINSLSINDPDAGPRLMTVAGRKELATLAQALRPWGIRLVIALNSTSPPMDESNTATWDALASAVYGDIPDLGGFLVDADWAGSPNAGDDPVDTRAAAINAIAAAVKPHGGVVVCRTCVFRSAIDEDDRDGPRAAQPDAGKTAFELFQPLDGRLDENVVLQIKHGPVDSQVREPPSPLLGAMAKTNLSLEFQFTQDHPGQQRHLCFLVPMWKQALEFDMQATDEKDRKTPVKEIAVGKTFRRPWGGFVAISNVRRTDNWIDHDLAMANVYGFGRLAWDPNLPPKVITEEWTRLTFGHDPLVVGAVAEMLLKSWRIYEGYTGPLGAGSFNDTANTRPAAALNGTNGWTPWLSADATGVGKDRTAATGTGFIALYRPAVAQRFESLETCPDDLLFFMHHVPYIHVLKSGKTVIQHIYDSHYNGARDAAGLVQQWESLKGKIDDQRHEAVLKNLNYQAGHAQLWRDAVCAWFLDKSGIADSEARVGNFPNRYEAEAIEANGVEPRNVKPWETASGGQCVQCLADGGTGSISMKFDGKAGWFDLRVRYFDENDGASQFKLLVAGQPVDQWKADDTLPDDEPNGHTSTRHETRRVALRPGDDIRIEAIADGAERAAIDYLEIEPVSK